MTKTQRKAIGLLLMPGNYLVSAMGSYRIRDKRHNPLMKIHGLTFNWIFPFLKRKTQTPVKWVISIEAILKERKNSWIKKTYLKTRNEKKAITKFINDVNDNTEN